MAWTCKKCGHINEEEDDSFFGRGRKCEHCGADRYSGK